MDKLYMNPEVCKIKFIKEVDYLVDYIGNHRELGWIVESAVYPFCIVSFKKEIKGSIKKIMTIKFDLCNYDIRPIKAKIMYPCEIVEYKFLNGVNKHTLATSKFAVDLITDNNTSVLLTGHEDTKKPFICMKGIYEYHSHGMHKNDYWDIYRNNGMGTLYSLVRTIWEYGVNNVEYNSKMTMKNFTKRKIVSLYYPERRII